MVRMDADECGIDWNGAIDGCGVRWGWAEGWYDAPGGVGTADALPFPLRIDSKLPPPESVRSAGGSE